MYRTCMAMVSMNIGYKEVSTELRLDEKLTLWGQMLLTIGTTFLSFGQIFKLLKDNQLPTVPLDRGINKEINAQPMSLYSGKRSYFDD